MRTARANRCVLERPKASQGQPAREHGREDFNRRACRCTMASTSCRMMDLVSGSLRAPRLSSTRCSVGPLQTSMTRCTTPAVTGVRSRSRAGAVSRVGAAVQRPCRAAGPVQSGRAAQGADESVRVYQVSGSVSWKGSECTTGLHKGLKHACDALDL